MSGLGHVLEPVGELPERGPQSLKAFKEVGVIQHTLCEGHDRTTARIFLRWRNLSSGARRNWHVLLVAIADDANDAVLERIRERRLRVADD